LRSFPGYHWIYWLGPFLGSLVAVLFYRLIKVLEFETANPGRSYHPVILIPQMGLKKDFLPNFSLSLVALHPLLETTFSSLFDR